MSTITMGVDLAKDVFSVSALDGAGRVRQRKDLKRDSFVIWLVQLPPGTVVAMEACSGAHHWARRCIEHGLVPRLMAAQFVKPFRKSQRNKNDRNDAEAIATAARQGNMRFVAVKTVDQQPRLSWHRVREGYKAEGLAISNRLRGLMAEFGVVVARSDHALRHALSDQEVRQQLPAMLQQLLDDLQDHWQQVRERVAACDTTIAAHAKSDTRSVRAQRLIGVGPLTADALVATIGDGREFTHGRQLSAWLGLTPTQHSSGGKQRLGEISRRGDSYLRTLLIQGARSSLQRANAVAQEKATAEQIWIRGLTQRLPFGKVLVAIANKHARQLWAMLARDEDYDAEAWLKHPMVQRPATSRKQTVAA
ncbi:IS110 family transposase [Lysobacter ciconiae]|uniref:IS110 family transposase n=1 Tax=Novilysobacter ciconiae TaxID=2781022 RepID=A0A7S6UG77_9GAMM|nr:IS110 family transposase [Lysobacter ciconiae]QOW19644.1 IS110 family transposase [Lysobacter ciconiae]